MQNIINRYKVLDQQECDNWASIPPSPREKSPSPSRISSLFDKGRKLLFFARNIKGLRAESEAFTEYLEEGLDCHPDLAWTGAKKVRTMMTEGEHPYKVEEYQIGAAKLSALPEVANRLSMRDKFDNRTYEALCQLEHVSYEDAVRCQTGTFELVDRIKEIHAEEKRRASMPVHFCIDHQVDPCTPVLDKKVLSVPPKLHWHHMENELMMYDEPEDLPELDEAWTKVRDEVELVEHFKRITWTHKKASKLPTSDKPKSIDHITHAQYGTYGTFKFDVKNDLYVQVRATLDGLLTKPTASNSMDTPIPAFLPRWNRRDNYTIAMGAAGRIGREPVPAQRMNRIIMEPYINKAVDFIIELLKEKGMRRMTLTPEDSWKWLASTSFPNIKKIAYMEAFKKVIKGGNFIPASEFDNTHKAFPKNENYLEGDKPQRMILAGSLEMAAVLGPMCAILGNYFFSSCYTSKKIPEAERPRLAIDRFGEDAVILNDMSAFEGSIDTWMKNHIEHRIMKYFFPDSKAWIDRCNEKLRIRCQDVSCTADSIRCSGDPQTSLGNSFTNLASIFAAYMYATDKMDLTFDECKNLIVAWVEGDDSLVKLPPEFHNPNIFGRYREAFIMMGFATKMEISRFVGDAGYCSMFFNRDLVLCPRVAQTFLDFPWDHTSKINRGKELLVMKALSLHHTSPGQPLTWALCRHYSPDRTVYSRMQFNSYEYEELQREGFDPRINGEFIDVKISAQLLGVEPDWNARLLFEEKYGISPERQIKLEKRILRFGVLGLLKKHKRSGFNWQYLAKLCQVDGINLLCARKYYMDRANIVSDVPDNRVSYSINRGKDGKAHLSHIVEQQHDRVDKPLIRSTQEPIDPITYRIKKCEMKVQLSKSARAHKNYMLNKIVAGINKKNVLKLIMVTATPAILFGAFRLYRTLSPLCDSIKAALRVPGICASKFALLMNVIKTRRSKN